MKKAKDFRKIARKGLSGHWLGAVGTTFLALLLSADVFMGGGFSGLFFIGCFVSLGLIQYNLNLVRKEEVNVEQLFSKTSLFGKSLWLRIRIMLFTVLWSLLFIIPGIIKAFAYSMSGFIMAEHPEMSAKEAMEESINMMQGNKGRLFCLQLSFIGWMILGLFTFGIGYFWLIPYMNASYAAFYEDISES